MPDAYHHGNLRNDLISEGLKTLCKDGFAAFSLRELSKRLGVSHAAAYRHFATKEELLKTIYLEASAQFKRALADSIGPDATGYEALMRLGIGYVRFFVGKPELLTLFTMMPSEGGLFLALFGPNAGCGNLDELPGSSGFNLLRRFALPLREEEQYAGLSDREILLGFWGKVHGIASILITQKNFIPEDQVDATIDRVVRTAF
ncbi:MAG TPA: TetR/AcrR family transcriptional regulator [Treponemataceae bacterium]|nr:TetR/AcrR family transcriptional regulator [Treponemataceae bacterium]